ncbi:MAG TPA: anti-sigma regulatory factor [Acidimicrobiales bacterium]|nr:anti-sigma regulatory factor [Acidimicrobiales bacterium]
MADELVIPITTDSDIVVARQKGRELAERIGFSRTDLTFIATAISEVARNITSYADRGEILFRIVDGDGRVGIHMEARDEGPGIGDLQRALEDGYSTAEGMGLGLPGARRLMDDFEVRSEAGIGTTVIMRKWRPDRG